MARAEQLITENLDLWSSAVKAKTSAGRGSSKKLELYGIARLRKLIIQLAIEGKLVPNNSHETPIPHDSYNSFDSINHQNPPLNWRTLLLSDGIKNKSGNSKLIKGKLFAKPEPGLFQGFSAAGPDVWCENFEYEGEAVIVSAVGARCGKAFKATGKWCAIANTNICWPNPELFTLDFACLILDNENFWIRSGSAQPFIKFSPSLKRNFSLPPLAEQNRIVAKVDELMALCDQLEEEQENNLETHETLVSTLLNALTSAAADATHFADAWQRIQDNFDILFTTESSVDQLKQTILQLAVMGKLVKQDPEDEPVEELLKANDKEREAIAENDRRAKKSNQRFIADNDRWIIPESWTWRALCDTALFVDYRGKTPTKINSGIRLITAKNVKKGLINLEPEEFLSEKEYDEWMTRGFPQIGNILFTTEAPMGNAAVVRLNERFALAQRVICFQIYKAFDPEFLSLQLLSEQFNNLLESNGTGMTAKGIKASKLKLLPIAIPPLAEQRRIVAKVDELMELCDQLKAKLSQARETQLNLADSIVEQAIQSPD